MDTAVLAYAQYLGIDLDTESHLVHIAKQALQELPDGWEVCLGEEGDIENLPYFYNGHTGESVWQHPEEEFFIKRVKELRKSYNAKNPSKAPDAKVEKSEPTPRVESLEMEDVDEFHDDDDDFMMPPKQMQKQQNQQHDKQATKSVQQTPSQRSSSESISKYGSSPGSDTKPAVAAVTSPIKPRNETPPKTTIFEPNWLESAGIPSSSSSTTQPARTTSATNSQPLKSALRQTTTIVSSPADSTNSTKFEPKPKQTVTIDTYSNNRNRYDPVTSSYQAPPADNSALNSLQEELRRMQQEMRQMKADHVDEVTSLSTTISTLRNSLSNIELDRSSDRATRQSQDEAYQTLLHEHERLKRQMSEINDKNSQQINQLQQQLQLEHAQKLSAASRNHNDELQRVNDELLSAKKQILELQDKAQKAESGAQYIKDNFKVQTEQTHELHKQTLQTYQKQIEELQRELSQSNDELASMRNKSFAATQAAQRANSELESVRVESAAVAADSQKTQTALLQALSKISTLENDLSRAMSDRDNALREANNAKSDLKRLQLTSVAMTDGAADSKVLEEELRRVKQTHQTEISRLNSRINELDGINYSLQRQIDRHNEDIATANRDSQRIVERAQLEVQRLTQRLADLEEQLQSAHSKNVALEREIMTLQDCNFKRDRQLKDERMRVQAFQEEHEEQQKQWQHQMDVLQDQLSETKRRMALMKEEHKDEVDRITGEVSERIPRLITSVTEQAENHFASQLQNELQAAAAQHQFQIDTLKRQLYEQQSEHASAMSKLKHALSDEQAEVERFRQKCRQLEARQNDISLMTERPRYARGESRYHNDNSALFNMTLHPQEASVDESAQVLVDIQKQLQQIQQLTKKAEAGPESRTHPLRHDYYSDVTHDLSQYTAAVEEKVYVTPTKSLSDRAVQMSPEALFHSPAPVKQTTNGDISDFASILEETAFEGIRDGGFHEGFWKAKYASTSLRY